MAYLFHICEFPRCAYIVSADRRKATGVVMTMSYRICASSHNVDGKPRAHDWLLTFERNNTPIGKHVLIQIIQAHLLTLRGHRGFGNGQMCCFCVPNGCGEGQRRVLESRRPSST